MAKARKDNKGRALRKGESQRTDNTYVYTYTDPFKKRRFVYAKDLQTLRQKEADLIKNQLDGLDVYVAGSATLNFVFDRYMSTKYDLRKTTRSNYNYMYDHFVREADDIPAKSDSSGGSFASVPSRNRTLARNVKSEGAEPFSYKG